MSDERDCALVLEWRSGNRSAFEQLLSFYERPIFNAAYRILNHREDATDVIQTTYLKAFEHADRFDPSQRFFSWIYRIAVNEALDIANSRRRSASVDDVLETLPYDGDGPDALLASSQLDAGMQAALMALKLEYRAVIVLKHVQECSYDEIADILDCPVKTVKSRLFTARQALRDVLLRRGLV